MGGGGEDACLPGARGWGRKIGPIRSVVVLLPGATGRLLKGGGIDWSREGQVSHRHESCLGNEPGGSGGHVTRQPDPAAAHDQKSEIRTLVGSARN